MFLDRLLDGAGARSNEVTGSLDGLSDPAYRTLFFLIQSLF